jgi:hypothetical protein
LVDNEAMHQEQRRAAHDRHIRAVRGARVARVDVLGAPPRALAQSPAGRDWRYSGEAARGQHYSRVLQRDRDNVGQLSALTYRTAEVGRRVSQRQFFDMAFALPPQYVTLWRSLSSPSKLAFFPGA